MKLKKIIFYLSLLILVVLGYFGYKIYEIVFTPNTTFVQNEVAVYVPTNSTYEQLKENIGPFIKDMEKFEALANQRGLASNIKAGKFILKKDMNTNAIVSSLRKSVPVRVTFNNQERLENLAGRIAIQIEADSTSIIKAFTDEDFFNNNEFTQETVYAMCLPNTFEFYWNTSAEQFRDKLMKEYRNFWNDDRISKANTLGLTPIQVSVLASIVQKETAKVDERARVAGVYLNRLKYGMPLQADPTVIYAYKKETHDFNQVIKRVYFKYLEVDSPYNTYKYAGLPPGPIFMPDVSSIDAVLNPEKHDYLYFCASVTNFGYHEFAVTLNQHIVNKNKYTNWLDQQTSK